MGSVPFSPCLLVDTVVTSTVSMLSPAVPPPAVLSPSAVLPPSPVVLPPAVQSLTMHRSAMPAPAPRPLGLFAYPKTRKSRTMKYYEAVQNSASQNTKFTEREMKLFENSPAFKNKMMISLLASEKEDIENEDIENEEDEYETEEEHEMKDEPIVKIGSRIEITITFPTYIVSIGGVINGLKNERYVVIGDDGLEYSVLKDAFDPP